MAIKVHRYTLAPEHVASLDFDVPGGVTGGCIAASMPPGGPYSVDIEFDDEEIPVEEMDAWYAVRSWAFSEEL